MVSIMHAYFENMSLQKVSVCKLQLLMQTEEKRGKSNEGLFSRISLLSKIQVGAFAAATDFLLAYNHFSLFFVSDTKSLEIKKIGVPPLAYLKIITFITHDMGICI